MREQCARRLRLVCSESNGKRSNKHLYGSSSDFSRDIGDTYGYLDR